MPFPPISACLVCEDVRQESRRLISLLGLYGIVPHVEILVMDFNQPIERLAFYLAAHGQSDGQAHRISFELRSPAGDLVLGPIETAPVGAPPPRGTPIRLAFAFYTTGLRLPEPGVYRVVIRLDANGAEHYSGE